MAKVYKIIICLVKLQRVLGLTKNNSKDKTLVFMYNLLKGC